MTYNPIIVVAGEPNSVFSEIYLKSINSKKGAEYYKGVGELPIIEQATISIWKSEQSMKDYAYSDKSHLKIIHKARKNNWYSEELFVRSNIISIKEFK